MPENIADYPYPLNLRWNHIVWFPVFHPCMLTGHFGLLADLEVKGMAVTLWAQSMWQHPPATLQDDDRWLAWHLRVPEEHWIEARARVPGPLDGWIRVRCGDEIRLTHPRMLEALEIVVKANKLRQRGTRDRLPGEPPDAGRAPKQRS